MSVDVLAAKHCWYIKNLYTVEQILLFPTFYVAMYSQFNVFVMTLWIFN